MWFQQICVTAWHMVVYRIISVQRLSTSFHRGIVVALDMKSHQTALRFTELLAPSSGLHPPKRTEAEKNGVMTAVMIAYHGLMLLHLPADGQYETLVC